MTAQRGVGSPACPGSATRTKEGGDHDQTGKREEPEAQFVESREGHITRTDLEWNQEVAKNTDQNGHRHEEDKDRPVHRDQHVVATRNQRSVIADNGGRKKVTENWNRMAGPGQLPAHGDSHRSSKHEIDNRGKQELHGDHLMIGVPEPVHDPLFPVAVTLVAMAIMRGIRSVGSLND